MTTERPSTSGRQGKPEGLAKSAFGQTWWVQQLFFPPDAAEATLRVGYIPSTNHLQVQVEVFDPQTKELLGMSSNPHIHVVDQDHAITAALAELERLWRAVLNPDPF